MKIQRVYSNQEKIKLTVLVALHQLCTIQKQKKLKSNI